MCACLAAELADPEDPCGRLDYESRMLQQFCAAEERLIHTYTAIDRINTSTSAQEIDTTAAAAGAEKVGSLEALRHEQIGRHFADDIFKCIFLNENVWISINISLKFVPKGPFNSSWPGVAYMHPEKQLSFP